MNDNVTVERWNAAEAALGPHPTRNLVIRLLILCVSRPMRGTLVGLC